MTKPSAPIVLLCVVAFFLPIFGGQVPLDRIPLAPGALLPAIFGGPETPLLTHFLFALLIGIALIVTLMKRQILQVPTGIVAIPLVVLFASLFASVFYASFRITSLGAALEWATFGLGAFGATMCLGRRDGTRYFLQSLVGGCGVLAILAIRQFGQMRADDPNFRVDGGWINPNALAGILMIGILCSLGLAATGNRRETALASAATAVQILAIWLTGSRAGFLALFVGIVVYFAASLLWKSGRDAFLRPLIGLAIGGILVALLIVSNHKPAAAPSAANSRSIAAVGTDQSAAFRKLLYQGAVQLIKERPLGVGVGTYRFYSAKDGLTTQTQLTHDSYLQVFVEGGIIAGLALIVSIGTWLLTMFRAPKTAPTEQSALKASVVAAIVATLAHGVVESNLYYFGVGLSFFMLLGLGILIAADGVGPEFMAKRVRLIGIAMTTVVVLGMGYLGVGEMFRSESRYAGTQKDYEAARNYAQSAAGMIPGDGDALGLLAQNTPPPAGLDFAKQAVAFGPSTAAFRRLAHFQEADKDFTGAIDSLNKALETDPNNLLSLRQLLGVHQARQNAADVKTIAERLIAVEETPYYRIRALPELIPTETFEARVVLAAMETDPDKKIALLKAATEGYLRYTNTTVPPVIRMGPLGYGDENIPKAMQKVADANEIAHQLQALYHAKSDTAGESFCADAEKAFDTAAESLAKAAKELAGT